MSCLLRLLLIYHHKSQTLLTQLVTQLVKESQATPWILVLPVLSSTER